MDWERAVDAHADRAYAFATALCGNEDDAKELVQAAFVKAMDRPERLPAPEQFGSWFLTVLKHIYIDAGRSLERRSTQSLEIPLGPGLSVADSVADERERDPSREFERMESDAAVRTAIGRLPPDQRAALLLVDLEGYGYDEAARALDCPAGTLRSRLFRAREGLKAILSDSMEAA
jgi:RNA polymerase sigma-70 factor, ECF subfamily